MWKLTFYDILKQVDTTTDITTQMEFDQKVGMIDGKIDQLQIKLQTEYKKDASTEHDAAYLITFMVVAYCDEVLMELSFEKGFDFRLFQEKRYNTIVAGELFYEYADNILHAPTYTLDVYLCMEFLLRHGFKGKYKREDAHKCQLYLEQIKTHIREKKQRTITASTLPVILRTRYIKLRQSRLYYAWPLTFLATVYLFCYGVLL